jgi:hypothetical protein
MSFRGDGCRHSRLLELVEERQQPAVGAELPRLAVEGDRPGEDLFLQRQWQATLGVGARAVASAQNLDGHGVPHIVHSRPLGIRATSQSKLPAEPSERVVQGAMRDPGAQRRSQGIGATPDSRRCPPADCSWHRSRPWQGDLAQRIQIDLGVPPRCLRAAMPQHLANIRERRALAQHVDGKRMTKLMRSSGGELHTGHVRSHGGRPGICRCSTSKGARERKNTRRQVVSGRPRSR